MVGELGTYIRVENFGYSRDLRLGTALGLRPWPWPKFSLSVRIFRSFLLLFCFYFTSFLEILVNV